MTAVATEPDFSAESYRRHANAIPSMDGHRATTLNIRFSGRGVLDRTSEDDLALLEAMRLGREVRLIVTGTISGKRLSSARPARSSPTPARCVWPASRPARSLSRPTRALTSGSRCRRSSSCGSKTSDLSLAP
jgi:hypothetical protein